VDSMRTRHTRGIRQSGTTWLRLGVVVGLRHPACLLGADGAPRYRLGALCIEGLGTAWVRGSTSGM
jgi:hypothetical protein